jgi:hypothetical protein
VQRRTPLFIHRVNVCALFYQMPYDFGLTPGGCFMQLNDPSGLLDRICYATGLHGMASACLLS